MIYDLSGVWNVDIGDGGRYEMYLPGTLDESGIGHEDHGDNQWHPDAQLGNEDMESDRNAFIATRYTRKHIYEGEACISKDIIIDISSDNGVHGGRFFLEVERARCLRLMVDGREVSNYGETSISTPHVFEITSYLCCKQGNKHNIMFLSDNSYPCLPYKSIVCSSAATDETQTNWNGLLGYLHIRREEGVFLSNIRVYPSGNKLSIHFVIDANKEYKGKLSVNCEALQVNDIDMIQREINIPEGVSEIVWDDLTISNHAKRWDEGEGNLYKLTAMLEGYESKTVTFGIRDFGDDGTGRLALNGRRIFLRSEANCAVFPEEGHSPMTVEQWTSVLSRYWSYGINCVRFHSHCPPEAAFIAADRLGMMMQPELSNWNPKDAFETEQSYTYYRTELKQILFWLANHPSFVMITLGNELHASKLGHIRMDALLALSHKIDNTRMIANGSNVHYGEIGCDVQSDFCTTQKYYDEDVRGTFANMEGYINHKYPSAKVNYDHTMSMIRKVYQKPVFGFEVGQFEILPDFDELKKFKGVVEPNNLKLIQKKVEKRGIAEKWKKYVEATGELSRIGYREEIEAAMRTRELSGISLLGLQDFPGQGTALVGMMNSHLEIKPFEFAKPDKFRSFFKAQLPLILLEKYTYENTEHLKAAVQVANYGREEIKGIAWYELLDFGSRRKGSLGDVACPVGHLTDIGDIDISLEVYDKPCRLNLRVWIDKVDNTYPIWVYPKTEKMEIIEAEKNIFETEHFDDDARKVLENGGIVYLTPHSTHEAMPYSIQTQFTTDFWSVGTFASQEGAMGQLIDEKHPLFRNFPTEFHTNWQWWPMAVQRAVILPKQYEAIITELDSYAYLRHMAQLMECRCLNGRLLFSTMGLQDLQQYPECRALLRAIYMYLNSNDFDPKQQIPPEVFEKLVK